MFSNVWLARAAASHWLSPSVSIPTSRYMSGAQPCDSAILIRIAQRHVPAIRLAVKRGRHLDAVDLGDELHGRLHLEVAGAPQQPAEAGVHRKGPDLVRVRSARLA